MAVNEEQAFYDMYAATLREWDERVQVGEWVYYIRAVRRKRELTRANWRLDGSSWAGNLWIFAVPFVLTYRWWIKRSGPWIVGVVRLGAVSTWNSVTPLVVHMEILGRDDLVVGRIAELASAAQAGHFAPASPQ